MATVPLTTPRVITPKVDIDELARYVNSNRVHTIQDLVSKQPEIADEVLRYRTGEPLKPQEAEAAINLAERYANEAYAQNHQLENLSRRDLLGGAFVGAFIPAVGSNTGAQTAPTAESNYLPRREFLRKALLGAGLGAGYSHAGGAALSRGAQLINPAKATLLLTALVAGVSQTACIAAMSDGIKLTSISEKLPKNTTDITSLDALLEQYVKYVDAAIKSGQWDSVYGPYVSQDHYAHVRQAQLVPHLDLNPGGIDSDVPIGTPVVAMHPMSCLGEGEGLRGPYGGIVINARKTGTHIGGYLHLSKTFIRTGQTANRGTIIALSGDTGTRVPHLHWEIFNGSRYNQLNLFQHGENQGKPKILTDKRIDKPFGNYELEVITQPFPNPEFVKAGKFYDLPPKTA